MSLNAPQIICYKVISTNGFPGAEFFKTHDGVCVEAIINGTPTTSKTDCWVIGETIVNNGGLVQVDNEVYDKIPTCKNCAKPAYPCDSSGCDGWSRRP